MQYRFHLKNMMKIKYALPFLFVILILTVTFLITILSYKLYQEHFIDNLSQEHINTLSQINSNVEKIKDEIITISDMFYNDAELMEIIHSDSQTGADRYSQNSAYVEALDERIHSTLTHYSFQYEMQLTAENGFMYSSDPTKINTLDMYKDELWYYNAESSSESLYWLPSIRIKASVAYDTNYFSLMRFIRSDSGAAAGLLMINVPESALYNTYENLISDNDENIYLVDKNGQIVSHKDKFMIGHYYYKMSKFYELFNEKQTATIMKSDTPYLFAKFETAQSSWIVVEEIPFSSIRQPFIDITKRIFIAVFAICLFSIFIAIIVSSYISHQISTVCKAMEKARAGDFNVEFPQTGFNEIRVISSACENFIIQITNLLNDIKKREHIKRVTELRYYQMQINPHFMHNTLFTIKCMVDMDKKNEACKMIDALNAMLKNILKTEQKLTTVREEVDTLKNYVFILQQRYANSFHVQFSIDPQCEEMLILRFILQPILENSVFHGFPSTRKNGMIRVSICADNDNIRLTVKDNGEGIQPDILHKIMSCTDTDDKHIGLSNIRSRLHLHYGDAASFSIASRVGEGCEVTIIVPQYKIKVENQKEGIR